MTESFRRHHASGCANRTRVRRIPLLHSRATSKASTPPLRMRGNNCAIKGYGWPIWFHHPTGGRQLVSDARKQPRGDTATPQEGSKLAPFGLLLGALFTRRTLPRRDPPRRTLLRRIFALEAQDQKYRTAHRKAVLRQPLQWNANLAVLCPQ